MGAIRGNQRQPLAHPAGSATEEALVRSMIEQQTTVNGRYRVDRRVGEGGMAVVFRGYDLLLGREVAIKALRPQYAADPAFRLRFEREARAAAGFRHPNIIQIFDVGEERGAPYFVMEYVEGQTLAEIVAAEAPFHPDDVAALLRQLGAALDYAHERGYVHRDVKPQNILVDPDGHARVVDFGIAKGLGDSDLTATGAGLGTVQYISPEQASGLMATPASDIYAAGVVAFEMLTGRLPFEADSPVAVAMKHVNDAPPPPSALLATVPPAVDAIVLRAMAKDPTQRFSSAGALAEAMGRWRRYLPPAPQTATGGWTLPTTPLAPMPTAAPAGARPGAVPAATKPPVKTSTRPRSGRG
ncbi:MAG TPA: protein kinase, partial [Thermomicrobiales bacterium]|nr:protein kinase [Thermomicrobiales bacterium]